MLLIARTNTQVILVRFSEGQRMPESEYLLGKQKKLHAKGISFVEGFLETHSMRQVGQNGQLPEK